MNQFVILPTGSARNKIEYLADFLDGLMIANPIMILPGQTGSGSGSTTPASQDIPTQSDGTTNFDIILQPDKSESSYPFEIKATFANSLDKLSDNQISFEIYENWSVAKDGTISDISATQRDTETIDAYKAAWQPVTSKTQPISDFTGSGFVLLSYDNATDAPSILNAQMYVTYVRK